MDTRPAAPGLTVSDIPLKAPPRPGWGFAPRTESQPSPRTGQRIRSTDWSRIIGMELHLSLKAAVFPEVSENGQEAMFLRQELGLELNAQIGKLVGTAVRWGVLFA